MAKPANAVKLYEVLDKRGLVDGLKAPEKRKIINSPQVATLSKESDQMVKNSGYNLGGATMQAGLV